MLIRVLGLGFVGRSIPATSPLVKEVVADAVPLDDAWALVMVEPVISPLKNFICWTVDELFELAPDDLITPEAVSVIVPVLPNPGMLAPGTLALELPPAQPALANANGPVGTKAPPALPTEYAPKASA